MSNYSISIKEIICLIILSLLKRLFVYHSTSVKGVVCLTILLLYIYMYLTTYISSTYLPIYLPILPLYLSNYLSTSTVIFIHPWKVFVKEFSGFPLSHASLHCLFIRPCCLCCSCVCYYFDICMFFMSVNCSFLLFWSHSHL